MIGRRALAVGGIGSLVAGRAVGQEPQAWTLRPIEHRGFNWQLVAGSDLIVRGILAAPTELAVSRVYKGIEHRTALDLRYSPQAGCGPGPEALMALKARDGVFCLASSVDGAGYSFTGCGPEAAAVFSEDYERALLKEIETQRAMARRVATALGNDTLPFEASVGAAVRAALAGDGQSALRGLRRSGLAAAPAMIRLLADRRKLPKEAVEGLRPHKVTEVADLLMVALDLMARDAHLGWPSPDAPAAQRQRIADAWRVWLGYSLGLEANG
jgi:hypothetical protein